MNPALQTALDNATKIGTMTAGEIAAQRRSIAPVLCEGCGRPLAGPDAHIADLCDGVRAASPRGRQDGSGVYRRVNAGEKGEG